MRKRREREVIGEQSHNIGEKCHSDEKEWKEEAIN